MLINYAESASNLLAIVDPSKKADPLNFVLLKFVDSSKLALLKSTLVNIVLLKLADLLKHEFLKDAMSLNLARLKSDSEKNEPSKFDILWKIASSK